MQERRQNKADVVVCGAGIAGIAAAYHLSVKRGVKRVVIVDDREPMTLTSDKGTQGYRNWWPGPDDTMLRLVSHSIDLMEDTATRSGNAFRMNRRGYLFATGSEAKLAELETTAREVSSYGMGELRVHRSPEGYVRHAAEGFAGAPTGADLLIGDEARRAFPYLAPDMIGALHIRRAGWFNGVAMGSWLLSKALAAGATFVRDRIVSVAALGGAVKSVELSSGERIHTERLVIAAGPGLPAVLKMMDLELPIFHELHAKVTVRDPKRAVPRDAPFVIWTDPIGKLPGGVHTRPVDLTHGDELYLIWTYETEPRPYKWPPQFDQSYREACLKGCAHLIPGLGAYGGEITGVVDGGFYCKTPENRPLVGPLPVTGAYVCGALSGSGLMAAHALGELVSQHVAGEPLPDYAKWFLPSRYDDASYRELMQQWGPLVGQL
jgi:glycine/D-amino acid oxidase-like deaminating enzyme